MATTRQKLSIEIHPDYLRKALEQAISSLSRAKNKDQINPAMQQLIEQDIAEYRHAIASIQQGK